MYNGEEGKRGERKRTGGIYSIKGKKEKYMRSFQNIVLLIPFVTG